MRRWLPLLLCAHIAVRVWTIAYFAPTIIAFQQMAYSSTIDPPALVEKEAQWRNLNYLRVLMLMAVSLALIRPTVWVGRMLCSGESVKA